MIHADETAGAAARSPFAVPAGGWLAVLKRTWTRTGDNNVSLFAAGVAFYAFAAIVPLLASVVLSYGLFAGTETVQRNVTAIFAMLPQEAASVVTDQLLTVVESSKGKQGLGLAIAIVIALYGATKGASAIVAGLNVANDVRETRGLVRLNLLYVGVVLGGVALVFLAMLAIALVGFLEGLIPGAPRIVLILVRPAGYILLATLVMTAAALLFHVGPARDRPRFVWLSPGSVGATALWLAGTSAFGLYAANFGNYGATYGSLSAVIVLLTWLWLSAYVFLLGAELNAVLEQPVPRETAAAPPARESRPMRVADIAVLALAAVIAVRRRPRR
ncbi:hypothetical protein ASE86_00655 [Sphingomonas sp. Leaf33]|uniref:YihY/virulence factor BrkB family protein n=1 Tax=Sphingomonas sp. Leaf33 TaxID=1736215 RepID=UPI0006FED9E9|nr:YihY/virulence factor BrkB family protein [Sphingomonas sp. Leaf33]KQN24841.1 hypothetical protein ASE86_00655 [Sphingomonas sp. Leaf33]